MNLEVLIALKDRITAPLKRVKEKLKNVTAVSEKLKNTTIAPRVARQSFGDIDSLTERLGGLKRLVAGAFAVGTIAAFGSSVTATLSEFERYEAVLTNTLGSKSEAKQSLDMLSDFAAKTPYAVDELTGSFVKLANQGFVPVENEMRQLGDLASSVGKPFDQLVEGILDAQTGEFERLKEFGIKAKTAGDVVTFSFKGIKTEVQNSEGAIKDYILSLGDMEGVSGSMAAIAGTTGGMLSNLADKYTQLKLEIGQGLKPAIQAGIEAMGWMIEGVRELVDWSGRHIEVVKSVGVFLGLLTAGYIAFNAAVLMGNVYTAIKTGLLFAQTWATLGLTAAVNLLNIGIGTTALLFGGAVLVLAALGAGFYYAYQKSEKFRATIAGIGAVISELWQPLKHLGLAIGSLFNKDPAGFITNMRALGSSLGNMDVNAAFDNAYAQSIAESKAAQKEKDKSLIPGGDNTITTDKDRDKEKKSVLGGISKVTGGAAQKSINVTINKLVETITFTEKGGLKKNSQNLERELTEVLLRAVRNFEAVV